MKNNVYLLIATFLITFSACDKEIEESTVENKSSMEINIPLNALISDNSKSETSTFEIDYSFSGTNTYSSKQLHNAEHITPENGTLLTIPGIADGKEIYSLLLEWGYKSATDGNFIMQEQIDLLSYKYEIKDEMFEVNLDKALFNFINEINVKPESSFQIAISGKTNFYMNCIAKLDIPVTIESKVFPMRF